MQRSSGKEKRALVACVIRLLALSLRSRDRPLLHDGVFRIVCSVYRDTCPGTMSREKKIQCAGNVGTVVSKVETVRISVMDRRERRSRNALAFAASERRARWRSDSNRIPFTRATAKGLLLEFRMSIGTGYRVPLFPRREIRLCVVT